MEGGGRSSSSLLNAVLEHARELLGVDQALIAEWDDEAGTTTIVATVGTLSSPEASAVGVPFPISDYYGDTDDLEAALPLMKPMVQRRDDPQLAPLIAAYMLRAGIAQEVYVHIEASASRRWVLECLYVDPEMPISDIDLERALELARLAKVVIESDRMARAVREEEARARLLVEALPVLVYQVDEQGQTRVPNPSSLVERLGLSKEELERDAHRHWLEHVHPDDRERVADVWLHAQTNHLHYDNEYRMIGAGEQVTWVRETAVPEVHPGESQPVWHGAIMDVTERVEAAEELRASEESRRALLEHVPALVYIQHDLERNTAINMGGFPELLGMTAEEWNDPQRDWKETVHPDDIDLVLSTWEECFAQRRPFSMEYRLVGRDGRVIWIRDTTAPLSGQNWHGITFDVTDLVETADRLRETQARYQSLVEQIPVVTYLDALDGASIYVSPQVEEMLGVDPRRWMENGYEAWLSAIHPDDLTTTDARFRQMLAEGGEFDAEYRVVLPGGEVRWVHDRARPILDGSGKPRMVQGVIVDTTDRRLVAQASEQQAQRQRAIADLGLQALEGLDADPLFAAAAHAVTSTLRAVGGAVLRADGEDLMLVGASGLVDGEPRCTRNPIRGGSPAGQAMLSDEPLICQDFLRESRFLVSQTIADLGLRSCAAVKIGGPAAAWGVLAVYGDEPAAFGQDAIDFLLAIANVLAAAIERQRVQAALEVSEEQRRRVLAELLRSADAERARIATELHDDTIQVMTAARIGLDRQANSVRRGDRPAADRAARLAREMLAEAIDRTRRLTFELRPPLLQARGLEIAVRELVEESAREAGFASTLHADIGRQPAEVESLCYRTVQELVANARKHSSASRLDVRMWQENGHLAAEVADDGIGFDLARALDRSITRLHLGLDSAAERIRLAGGELSIDSGPGRGTRIRFTIPT